MKDEAADEDGVEDGDGDGEWSRSRNRSGGHAKHSPVQIPKLAIYPL